jgi:hypothetical protein
MQGCLEDKKDGSGFMIQSHIGSNCLFSNKTDWLHFDLGKITVTVIILGTEILRLDYMYDLLVCLHSHSPHNIQDSQFVNKDQSRHHELDQICPSSF